VRRASQDRATLLRKGHVTARPVFR
jgi:hypothetical protein